MNKLGVIFARNLAKRREAEGLSQDSFAEKLGISLRAYQRYESGERTPKGSVLESIAKNLKVEPASLYREEENKPQVVHVSLREAILRFHAIPDEVYELAYQLQDLPPEDKKELWDDVIETLEITLAQKSIRKA